MVWLPTRLLPPGAVNGRRLRESEAALAAIPAGVRVPLVLYAHGCAGPDADLAEWGRVLADAGYAMLAPDGAASGGPAPACRADRLYGPRDLPRFAQREVELRYAIGQAATLPWVTPERIVVLGFDHGAVVAAGWREPPLAGYIVTGWTCTSPDVRRGLTTPLDRAVLAIRWAEDPLFRDPAWNGDCGATLDPRPGRSLVLEGRGHSTAPSPEAREAVLRFLQAHAPH